MYGRSFREFVVLGLGEGQCAVGVLGVGYERGIRRVEGGHWEGNHRLTRYTLFPPQGYVLVEYPTVANAKAAIEGANGTKLLDQTIGVDYAFVRPPPKEGKQGAGRGGAKGARGTRNRSRSPEGDGVKDD